MDRAVNKGHKLLTQQERYEMVRVMTDYHTIPELLEEYMQSHGGAGLWVTVPEFRTYFALNERFITCNIRVFPPDFPWALFHLPVPGGKNRKTDRNHSANTDDQTLFYHTKTRTSENINSLDKRMIDHRR